MSSPLMRTAEGRPTEFGRIYPPDHEWLAKAPVEEVLFPDLSIVDPHHHLWDHPGYRYLLDEFIADADTGHNVVATVFAECLSMYRTEGPEALRPVGETDFVAGVAASAESGASPVAVGDGITGFADLRLGAAVEEVLQAHLAAGRGRFKGVRFATSWDADPEIENSHTGSAPHLLADPEVRKGAAVLRDLGLVLDTWVFFPQILDVADLADALPDLSVVLDHCGGPLGYGHYTGHRDEDFATWRRGVQAVAERPNVTCKIGGLVARLAAFDYRTAERPASSTELAALWRPWIETCIEAFGPDRCMFESNYPVDKVGVPYATLWNTFKRITESMTAAERGALFAGTARRVYGL
ncbi:amidohydrolase family protein [Pseudonocardia kujensis]|uniref:amidohydrolase family protein n=1 Tax=Pseudonocardia kujensis TaxID=1128675 RepID=UPI001E2D14B0|nr:amidohydrolase family protein [Pseudonocardia kujensis]MCE0766025.1 amidohydrolase family protein [Pseudonocardia kujensis]